MLEVSSSLMSVVCRSTFFLVGRVSWLGKEKGVVNRTQTILGPLKSLSL